MKVQEYEYENSYLNPRFAELYDFILKKIGRQHLEWELWKFCAATFGDPILEMGCGTGERILALAKEGYSVLGLDYSPEMLNLLRKKLLDSDPRIQQNVRFVNGNMVTPSINFNNFHLVIFGSSQFLHLETDEQRLTCLRNSRCLIAHDGVIAISNAKLLDRIGYDWQEQIGSVEDEWLLQTRCHWHRGAYQQDFKLISKLGKQQELAFKWRLYPIEDSHMKWLIEKAGLQCISSPLDSPTQPTANLYLCVKDCRFEGSDIAVLNHL